MRCNLLTIRSKQQLSAIVGPMACDRSVKKGSQHDVSLVTH
jgi:hypothetical protein